MEKVKKWGVLLIEIAYIVSMTVLGYFSIRENTFVLPLYQIIVTVYIVCGIAKYKTSGGLTTELKNDMLKDFFTAILSVIVLMKISNSIDYSAIDSAVTIFVHNMVLIGIFLLIKKSEKLSGSIVYFTYPAAFLIALIMIKIGVPIFLSMIIGVIIPEPFNYWGYRKKSE